MSAGYESFFGLAERPFSLTSDAKYFYQSRSHGRAVEMLSSGFRARERFFLVTGDLGVGKTVLCRTLVEQIRKRAPVAYIASPLITPGAFDRVLLKDFGLQSLDDLDATCMEPVIIVDEAHTMPVSLLDNVLAFSRLQANGDYLFRIAFVGQSAPADPTRIGVPEIDDRVTTRARLLPLGREECAAYIEHRLLIAGANHGVQFSARAHDYVFGLSGGVPRLVNLLCERALQEAATAGTHKIEPATVDLAASALQLLRARPRRFRWFSRRAS